MKRDNYWPPLLTLRYVSCNWSEEVHWLIYHLERGEWVRGKRRFTGVERLRWLYDLKKHSRVCQAV
jgi:hypothetical protein